MHRRPCGASSAQGFGSAPRFSGGRIGPSWSLLAGSRPPGLGRGRVRLVRLWHRPGSGTGRASVLRRSPRASQVATCGGGVHPARRGRWWRVARQSLRPCAGRSRILGFTGSASDAARRPERSAGCASSVHRRTRPRSPAAQVHRLGAACGPPEHGPRHARGHGSRPGPGARLGVRVPPEQGSRVTGGRVSVIHGPSPSPA